MKRNKYISNDLKELTIARSINGYHKTVILIFTAIILFFLLGSLIKYPEKIVGKAHIVTDEPLNTLYAPTSGKVKVLIKENVLVEKGQIIGIIENIAEYYDIEMLKNQLSKIDLNKLEESILKIQFEDNLDLGEIQSKYYEFLLSISQLRNLVEIKLAKKKLDIIDNKIKMNQEIKIVENKIYKNFKDKIQLLKNSKELDSVLYEDGNILKKEYLQSKLSLIEASEYNETLRKNIKSIDNANRELYDERELINKEYLKTIKSILFEIQKNYFELKSVIGVWESKYLIKSTIDGFIEYNNPTFKPNQYVNQNQPIFFILPKIKNYYAEGILSSKGYGKISKNDTLFIKLDDFPYEEYGELKGVIKRKSQVFHDSIYYVDIALPDSLKTNHSNSIDFYYNMPGKIEFYTKKRSITQRLFDDISNNLISKN